MAQDAELSPMFNATKQTMAWAAFDGAHILAENPGARSAAADIISEVAPVIEGNAPILSPRGRGR